MATIVGPKGAGEPKSKGAQGAAAPAQDLHTQGVEKVQESPVGLDQAAGPGADAFVDTPSMAERRQPHDLPGVHGDGARGASLRARLQALGVKGAGLIKAADTDAVRYSSVPGGRILHGSLAVESTSALAKLEGVVRVTGDLSIQESLLKSADLLVLRSLVEVGGRLTLEGNSALYLLDALQNLERARGIYVGFNPGIARVSLPKLKELQAALIFEANTALTEIHLPAFTKGGLYVHVHDNQALTTVLMPSFASTKGALSFIDNPRLMTVRLAKKSHPASVGALELQRNGAASYPLLFAHVAGR